MSVIPLPRAFNECLKKNRGGGEDERKEKRERRTLSIVGFLCYHHRGSDIVKILFPPFFTSSPTYRGFTLEKWLFTLRPRTRRRCARPSCFLQNFTEEAAYYATLQTLRVSGRRHPVIIYTRNWKWRRATRYFIERKSISTDVRQRNRRGERERGEGGGERQRKKERMRQRGAFLEDTHDSTVTSLMVVPLAGNLGSGDYLADNAFGIRVLGTSLYHGHAI